MTNQTFKIGDKVSFRYGGCEERLVGVIDSFDCVGFVCFTLTPPDEIHGTMRDGVGEHNHYADMRMIEAGPELDADRVRTTGGMTWVSP